MFIKHGDGKIVAVINEDDLTEDQKKAAESLVKEIVKQSKESDTSQAKKSGS